MKNILVASLFVLTGTTAFACPNLTGSWVCNADSDTPSYVGLRSITTQGEQYLLRNTTVGNQRSNKTFVIGEAPRGSSCSKNSVEIVSGGNHTIYTLAGKNKLLITSVAPEVAIQACQRAK